MTIPTEYKGLNVIRKKQGRTPKVNASYNKRTKIITIYDNWFTQSKLNREAILLHEHAHHIYYKMPLVYRKLWGYISVGRLVKLSYIMGFTKYKKNAYVTDYAKKNVKEDWSECVEASYILSRTRKKLGSYAQFKSDVAESMYNYFSKKELGEI